MTDVCPNCGSVSIASNQKALRRTSAAAAMASSNPVLSVLGAVGGALNAVSPAFTCQACGHGFESPSQPHIQDKTMNKSRLAAINTHHGKPLTCDQNKKGLLVANRKNTENWEVFGIEDLGDNKVALVGVNGLYVACNENCTLVADRPERKEWETFTRELHGDHFALKTWKGTYVCAEPSGRVIADRKVAKDFEMFTETAFTVRPEDVAGDELSKAAPVAGLESLVVTSKDGIRIVGWLYTPKSKKLNGTAFFIHGFMSNCSSKEIWDRYIGEADKHGLAFIAFDLREHGLSGCKMIKIMGMPMSTFGGAEMWDFVAIMDEAEKRKLPQPYIAIGDSLGGMTAQRTAITDKRIAAAFLHHTPGWPLHAIGCRAGPGVLFVNVAMRLGYKWDVLKDGDIRNFPGTPNHRPLILHIMGDKDHYDISKTKVIYDHWYADHPELDGGDDLGNPKARKWFITVPGAKHTDQDGGKNCVWHWKGYNAVFDAFIQRALGK